MLSAIRKSYNHTINFAVQLAVDRIGYRPCIVAAHVITALRSRGLSTLYG